ncbi:MAG: hypothetical protein ACSHW0_09325 [Thalassotalea sp.]
MNTIQVESDLGFSQGDYFTDDFDDFDDGIAGFQIAYTNGKAAPMKTRKRKPLNTRQRLEELKDNLRLSKAERTFDDDWD